MATRRIVSPETGLTPDTAALALTPVQRAALEMQAVDNQLSEDDEIYEETSADRIETMLTEHRDAQRATVKLYRVTGPNQYNWCSDYSPENFEAKGLEGIREEWGPGTYQVRLYATKPNDSRYCVRAKENVTLEAPRVSMPNVLPSHQGGGDLAAVLRTIAEGQQRLMETIANRPQVDPMQSLMQTLTLAKSMRDVFAPPAQQASPIGEIVQAIRQLREVSDEINPKAAPEKEEPDLMSMAGSVLSLVKNQMGQQAPQQPQETGFPHITYTPPTESQAADPAAHQAPQTEEEEMQLLAVLQMKAALRELLKRAKSNADISESAEWLAEKLPDDLIEPFFSAEWWSLLTQFAPEISPYQEWATKVREAAQPLFEVDEEPAPAPAAEEGHPRTPPM